MTHSIKRWPTIDVTATRESCEAIEYGLMEAGALGTETSDVSPVGVRVRAYFDVVPDLEVVRATLLNSLPIYNLASWPLLDLQITTIENRSSLPDWKKH